MIVGETDHRGADREGRAQGAEARWRRSSSVDKKDVDEAVREAASSATPDRLSASGGRPACHADATPMIVLHVLSFVFGAAIVAGGSRLGAQDRRPAPGGLPAPVPVRLRRGPPAAGAPLGRPTTRSASLAQALRAGCAGHPPVGLDDPDRSSAFTFIFWGTGHSAGSVRFEISVSSLTTLGFSEPTGRRGSGSPSSRPRSAWASWPCSSATCLPSTPPTTAARRGSTCCAPSPASPRRRRDLLQTLHRTGRPRQPGFLAARSPTGSLDARADPYGVPDPHVLPRGRTPTSRGWHHRGRSRRGRAGRLGV